VPIPWKYFCISGKLVKYKGGDGLNYRLETQSSNRKVIEFQKRRQNQDAEAEVEFTSATRRMAERIEVKPSTNSKGRKLVLVMVGLIAIALAGIPLLRTMSRSAEVAENFEQTQQAHNQAVQQNRVVQQEYLRLQDPEYLAEIARRDYYYAKPGEIIFDLGDAETEADLFQQSLNEEANNGDADSE